MQCVVQRGLPSMRKNRSAAGASAGSSGSGDDSTAQSTNVPLGWRVMYRTPPTHEVSVPELETVAAYRQALLRDVENIRTKHPSSVDMQKREIQKKIVEYSLTDLTNDNLSHHVLRLAYCSSENLRRWFLQQECQLFRVRLESQPAYKYPEFLRLNKFDDVDEVSAEEMEQMRPDFESLDGPQTVNENKYFKVAFERVTDLVASRRVIVKKGVAYVNTENLASILLGHFRAQLSRDLMTCMKAKRSLAVKEKYRLAPFLDKISEVYVGQENEFGANGRGVVSEVKPKDVDRLSQQSFPLCMRHLQDQLKKEHHLRHGGRMQYGLFLKGIGMTLEDALTFWRDQLAQSVGVDRFEKEYAYNIRHNYGKEGRRANYTPYSCMKCIKQQPANGDHHGCPFRHWDVSALRRSVERMGISASGVQEVTELVKQHHYQVACGRVFELTHPNSQLTTAAINHPNQYFDESIKYWKEKNGETDATTSTTPSKAAPTSSAPAE